MVRDLAAALEATPARMECGRGAGAVVDDVRPDGPRREQGRTDPPRGDSRRDRDADGGRRRVYGIAKALGEMVSGATGNSWLWPASETIHFVGLCLLFSVVLLVDLRILGIAKPLSFPALYQLLPVGMVGFGLNLLTGMLFFIGKPAMYMTAVFYWKIALIVLGGINVLYFTLIDEVWAVGPGDDAPRTAKLVGASAIIVWFGVLYCGHMLPFLGRSF